MASDELTKALLLEGVSERRAIAEALFASVTGDTPLLQALAESGAASANTLARYLERRETPFVKHVVPAPELVDRLPPDLCRRVLAIPLAVDLSTGVVEVAVADPADPHPASEVGYHLGLPVRMVRATVASLEEALRRLRMRPGAQHEPVKRKQTLQPPEPQLSKPRRGGLVIEEDDSIPPFHAAAPQPAAPQRIRTPPWGTPAVSPASMAPDTDRETPGDGSDIPIPLTRRGGALGEGYSFDTTGFRDVVEKRSVEVDPNEGGLAGSFIPGPPPLPGSWTKRTRESDPRGRQPAYPEMGSVLAALKNAGSRDEILELVLTGARLIATRVALFVVKKGGYHGWVASPEFADRTSLQAVLIPLDADSVFDRAIHEDVYVGPLRNDHVHAPLLRAMRSTNCEIAAVPIRVSGKTAVIIVAADVESPTIAARATRRLEDLARAGGDAFARLVRTRR